MNSRCSRTATLLNPGLILKWTHVAEPWPDLEMNSGQVAFLDFVRPRCWILAWSWNELSSGGLFWLRTAMLLNPGLILKWTQLRQLKKISPDLRTLTLLWNSSSSSSLNWSLSRGQKWWMHSLRKSPRASLSPFFWYLWNFWMKRERELSSRSRPRSHWPYFQRSKAVRSSFRFLATNASEIWMKSQVPTPFTFTLASLSTI